MAKRSQTPSFTLELPLRVELWQEHILEKRFEAARFMYNALLHKGMKRLRRMWADPRYELAKQVSGPEGKK
ncbi:hypothetical protein [Brockia lithotrophica]|uniref:Uncharacterized protein n=1 Tax=Brockia lithotrophica TaxID=933949 RepID=A0A660KW56_9BACL|nr:hypothetical protein [Brockia lithotrophica]RKQ84243.1 hypothetical protein C7438_1421 [Brockia lithotrophica]